MFLISLFDNRKRGENSTGMYNNTVVTSSTAINFFFRRQSILGTVGRVLPKNTTYLYCTSLLKMVRSLHFDGEITTTDRKNL